MFQTLTKAWETLSRLTMDTGIGKYLIMASAFLSTFFLPILPILLITFIATIVDMYYGIKVARMNGVEPQSRYMWTGTLRKIRDTFVIITMAHAIETTIISKFIESPILVGGASIIITLTEMWSILENMNTLNPKGPWRVLGKFLKKKGSTYLNVDLDQIHKEIKDEDIKRAAEIQGVPCNDCSCDGGMDNG